MSTTTASALGWEFNYDEQVNNWYGYINNGEHTPEQEASIVAALVNAQVSEFDELLPEGHRWEIRTSELIYPVGDETDPGDLGALLEQAVEAVAGRYSEIEAEALKEGR